MRRNAPNQSISVSAKLFSVARSEHSPAPAASPAAVVVQIRLKNQPSDKTTPPRRLLSRRNTEFWFSAND